MTLSINSLVQPQKKKRQFSLELLLEKVLEKLRAKLTSTCQRLDALLNRPENVQKHKEFFDAIQNIPYMNNGGCLFMCLVFYRWCKKNNISTKNFHIWQISSKEKNVTNNVTALKNDEVQPISDSHFFWSLNGDCFDGDFNKEKYYTAYMITFQSNQNVEDFMIRALRQYDQWNSCFDRENAAEIILDSLQISMDDVAKESRLQWD